MKDSLTKQLRSFGERAGVKPAYLPQVASILAHCRDVADLENSIGELRRSQPDWFYAAKRRAA